MIKAMKNLGMAGKGHVQEFYDKSELIDYARVKLETIEFSGDYDTEQKEKLMSSVAEQLTVQEILELLDMEEVEQNLGLLLKEKREELEMTQQEVADKIGSPLVTYQRWEYNNCSPSAKYLIKLQSALEISADDLKGL